MSEQVQGGMKDGEFVITSLGDEKPSQTSVVRPSSRLPALVGDHEFAREVVIRAASVVHGARQALHPVTLFRARRESKLELKRLRKERKIEVKEALREYRARHRA